MTPWNADDFSGSAKGFAVVAVVVTLGVIGDAAIFFGKDEVHDIAAAPCDTGICGDTPAVVPQLLKEVGIGFCQQAGPAEITFQHQGVGQQHAIGCPEFHEIATALVARPLQHPKILAKL